MGGGSSLRVGVIGTGAVSQIVHVPIFSEREDVHLLAVADVETHKAETLSERFGVPLVLSADALITHDELDAVVICTPNHLHEEMAVAAAEAGKMILCEKPLARTVAEGETMCAAVEAANVPTMVWFNYRRVPAIALAKQIVDEGRIGRPFHYRGTYLQDWTISEDVPQGGGTLWRLDVDVAGSGVTGDLLAHSIDTAEWVNGPVQSVVAKTETFVKERIHQETGKVQPVGIDDACMFLAVFANGSMGTFESTRYARGRKNFNTYDGSCVSGCCNLPLHI